MKVSVVIPVYKVKPYLERCVNSVLRQTYKDLEIILVDDGSPDDCGVLCDQLASKDSRIQVIHQQNQGLSGARNTGIRQATGEFIIFFDSDDEWLIDDGVETCVKNCDAATDLIFFKAVDIWSQDRRMNMPDYDVERISQLPSAQAVFSYLIQNQKFRAGVWQLMIRRIILVENNIFFPSGLISEDVWFDMHLWQHVKNVKILNINFYGYYHREASITTSPSIRVYNSYDTIFDYWKKQCNHNCVNADIIRIYLAELWVSRGYKYYQIQKKDKTAVLDILKRHADLLTYAGTPKAKRTAKVVRILGVKLTLTLLGFYWRIRTLYKEHAI